MRNGVDEVQAAVYAAINYIGPVEASLILKKRHVRMVDVINYWLPAAV
jgi:hypothetical protein